MGPPPYSGMGGGRNSSSSSDGLAVPPLDTNSHSKINNQAQQSGSTATTSSGHVSSFRSAETAVREVVVRTKSLFRGTDGRSLLNGAAGAAASAAVSATRRRGSSDIFSRRRGDNNGNNNNDSGGGNTSNNGNRRANNSKELGSTTGNSNGNGTGNVGNASFEDMHPERTKLNHHITLAGVRPPEGMSSSGLPAVRMSTLSNIVLPSTFHFEPLEDTTAVAFTQAGGHSDTFRSNGPVLDKKVVEREAKFYEEALVGMWPVQFLPKFFGRTLIDGVHAAIKIENLTYGLKNPCVMDLKMGFQSVENTEPSLLKRLRHTALDHLTGSKHSGVRLEGLSMYRTLEKRKMKGSKIQSHTVSANMGVSLQDVLTFFLTDESGVRTDIALRFQAHIEALLHYFCKYNTDKLFIGSSILLIYDNDNSAPHMRWARALQKLTLFGNGNRKSGSGDGEDTNGDTGRKISPDRLATLTRRTKVDVRMIDFAHTGKLPMGQLRDEGYIQGLHTILTALKAIRADRKKPIFTLRNAALDALAKKESTRSMDKLDEIARMHTPQKQLPQTITRARSVAEGDTTPRKKENDGLDIRRTESEAATPRRKPAAVASSSRRNNNGNNNAGNSGDSNDNDNSANSGRLGSEDTAFNFATLYEQCSPVSTDSVR